MQTVDLVIADIAWLFYVYLIFYREESSDTFFYSFISAALTDSDSKHTFAYF